MNFVKIKFSNRVKITLVWVIFSAVLSLYYTNCENYTTSTIQSAEPAVVDTVKPSCDTDPSSTACSKEKAENYDLHKGFTFISIEGANTIQMTADNAYTVSGQCNKDIFPKAEIYYRLVNSANSSLLIANDPSQSYNLASANPKVFCIDGRWTFTLFLDDKTIRYMNGSTQLFQKSVPHTLIVEMIMRDENNTLYHAAQPDTVDFVPVFGL